MQRSRRGDMTMGGRRRAAVLALPLLVMTAAHAAPAYAGDATFRTPSGNVQCQAHFAGTSGSVQCWVYSTFGHGCPFAAAWLLGPRSHVKRICPGDRPGVRQGGVLAYGTSRRFGVFGCTSKIDGLRCRSALS